MLQAIRNWNKQHRVIAGIIFICVMALIGTLGGKAFADTPQQDRTTNRICVTSNPEVTCASITRHVHRFKAGRYGKAHGLHHPLFRTAAAKAVLMKRLARKMPAHPFKVEASATCAKAPAWTCDAAHTKLPERSGTAAGHRRCMRSDICRAYNRYGASATGATCIGVDATYFHPECIPYKMAHPGWKGFTKKQVQIGGGTILCGAGVVVGIATGVGTVIVGIGAAACLWDFWSRVDPG